MLLLFAVSATYHVFCAGPRLRSVMRRLDHSTIFVAIAGISTPFFLLAVEGAWGIALLALVWSLAAVGIAIRQTSWLPDWAASTPYLVVGWSPVAALPALVGTLSHGTLVVMLLSGLVYSLGAVIYAVRRPDPFPGVFGYHEVFHALVTVATLSMYLVIRQDVLAL
jgi:hemolysin III